MLRAEVCLSKLLALRVELDGSVEASKFFMLLADAQVSHDLDRDEVIELKVKAFDLWVGAIEGLRALNLNFFPKAEAAMLGEPQGFLCKL